jgi:hypothetical protein
MRKLVPQDGTSLENAFAVVTTLSPVPDNVILITTGCRRRAPRRR